MNVESLKSELQQVLDNDVILRKEFSGLKRSLSDYRNQLIMRDEDCKRLQVTIDVLNTKLVVMERDNTTYKAELSSFKELRGTIKDQLQAKQDEIDARLLEIQALRDDLNTMAAGYESKIEEMRNEANLEVERVSTEFTLQLSELRTNTHYKESGIREEFENRVSELTISWADKEQGLLLNHEEDLLRLKETHVAELEALRNRLSTELGNKITSVEDELATARIAHDLAITQQEEAYRNEIGSLRSALEEQRSTLTTNFNAQVENLRTQLETRESQLIAGYESRIEELSQNQGSALSDTVSTYETKMATLVAEYEEKLSHTLIHSNSQNSKLNEELARAQSENEAHVEKLSTLEMELTSRTQEVTTLSTQLNDKETELKSETGKFSALTTEFADFRAQTLLSDSDQVSELNQQIATLNSVHSDYVNELTSQIESLNVELKNLGLLFEGTTNSLSETENALETKNRDLEAAMATIDEMKSQIQSFDAVVLVKEQQLVTYKEELELRANQELTDKLLEYDKLLAENTNLIEEIDAAQDKVEAQEQEITLLKGELEEAKLQSAGKSEYFKETLANRNFEITNLEANNAALHQEILQLKNELADLQNEVSGSVTAEEELTVLQEKLNFTSAQNIDLSLEIDGLKGVIATTNEKLEALNGQLRNYETEIADLRSKAPDEEQEAFIDRLFKQIDALNDQHLTLLDEKEQMAAQLMKMNEVVGALSQQVDSEKIDVTSLNNHRKNVILANNSEGAAGKSPMKEQINDLVREIDKCIALLSA